MRIWITLFSLFVLAACQNAEPEIADMLLINGNVYTVDANNPTAEAVAVKDGKILAVGTSTELEKYQGDSTTVLDLNGQFVMPGFIEGHGHFSGLGSSLMNLNFLKSKSWDDIVADVKAAAEKAEEGEWITGRGWHQEKWGQSPDRQVLGYPYHDHLSDVSPHNPVVLRHASGHSLFANKKAMDIAGITRETPDPVGGEIVRDSRGEAIGVFEERAMGLIMRAYEEYLDGLSDKELEQKWYKAIELAEAECLENGITSFQDAGAKFYELERYKGLAESGELDLRLWAMIRHSSAEMQGKLDTYPWIGLGDNFLTERAIKTEVDGALGAYGAWLLESYDDKPDFVGQNTTTIEEVETIAQMAMENDLQLCVHAIGDRANREVLDICERLQQEKPELKDQRWRMEHAQHIHPDDVPRFAELGVIASMQGIHCTSDAPFVVKRLGEQRAREGAYPWRSLLDAGAVVTNGTDAPVEDVSAIESFFASVTRKRFAPDMVFYPEQAMSREEAIYSYTMAPAYAGFEEDIKGSLEVGKLADIVILSNDLLNCTEDEILDTQVAMTIVGGEIKYENK